MARGFFGTFAEPHPSMSALCSSCMIDAALMLKEIESFQLIAPKLSLQQFQKTMSAYSDT